MGVRQAPRRIVASATGSVQGGDALDDRQPVQPPQPDRGTEERRLREAVVLSQLGYIARRGRRAQRQVGHPHAQPVPYRAGGWTFVPRRALPVCTASTSVAVSPLAM